jgi:hypothetical protein
MNPAPEPANIPCLGSIMWGCISGFAKGTCRIDRANEKDVQVMIEGHGHVPLNEVDVAAAYDHILMRCWS